MIGWRLHPQTQLDRRTPRPGAGALRVTTTAATRQGSFWKESACAEPTARSISADPGSVLKPANVAPVERDFTVAVGLGDVWTVESSSRSALSPTARDGRRCGRRRSPDSQYRNSRPNGTHPGLHRPDQVINQRDRSGSVQQHYRDQRIFTSESPAGAVAKITTPERGQWPAIQNFPHRIATPGISNLLR